jgi:hypothetical protein
LVDGEGVVLVDPWREKGERGKLENQDEGDMVSLVKWQRACAVRVDCRKVDEELVVLDVG